jgi:hypothetical protein
MAQTNTFKKPGTNHAESWTHHECAPLTHIEYNIYSYSNDDNPRACWQKCGSADQPELAINHAEELYNSGQFSKVEVKQKYYDLRTQRNIDETWRVFEKGGRRTSPSTLIIGFAVTSAIIAFAWTYLMAV